MDGVDGIKDAPGETNGSRACSRRPEEMENFPESRSLIQRLKRALSFRSKPAPTLKDAVTYPATSGTLSELKAARRRLRAESSNKSSHVLDIEAAMPNAAFRRRPLSGTLSEITPNRQLPQAASSFTDGYGVTLPDLPKPDFSGDYKWDCGKPKGGLASPRGGSSATLIAPPIAGRSYIAKNVSRHHLEQTPILSGHTMTICSMDIGVGGLFASIALHNSMNNTPNYGHPADYYQRPSERRSLKAKRLGFA